jgi:RimJ/RimL family protein N-acetyltransferase
MLIREININDVDQIFELRNLQNNFKFFKNNHVVTNTEHFEWVTNRVNNFSELTLIAELQSRILGICYLVIGEDKKIGIININLHPDSHGTGIAHKLCSEVMQNSLKFKIEKIQALVMKENLRSINFFRKMNFYQEDIVDQNFAYFSKHL